ncbi:hypothetical protein Droror1_Dr00009523 [Drosera rotundifolia]
MVYPDQELIHRKMSDHQIPSISTLATQICTQIATVFSSPTTPSPLTTLVSTLSSSQNGHIFLHGVGREGLMMKALCMRLAHLGLKAHCVFDMTTPPIGPHDLLIASAGPGGFPTVNAICRVARDNGARVVVLTARPERVEETGLASVVVHVPARTMAEDEEEGSEPSLLPMGSLFEGALFVLFEMVVFVLAGVLGQTAKTVRARHTNLE